jgi:hypothetical protein
VKGEGGDGGCSRCRTLFAFKSQNMVFPGKGSVGFVRGLRLRLESMILQAAPAAFAAKSMRGSAGETAAATTGGASSTSLAGMPMMKLGVMV